MIISFFGKQSFKFQHGDLVIGVNPVGKSNDAKPTKYGADIFLSTTSLPDYRGLGDKETIYIKGPGEYEVKSIFIKGFQTKCEIDGEQYLNTAYHFTIDNIDIVFLGPITSTELSSEAREGLGKADIVFVPVGALLDAEKAYKLASSFEPALVVPMDYGADENSLKKMLKLAGNEKVEPIDKLTLKKKDLDKKDIEIVLFGI